MQRLPDVILKSTHTIPFWICGSPFSGIFEIIFLL